MRGSTVQFNKQQLANLELWFRSEFKHRLQYQHEH
jgi:hypothetical protein